MTVEDRTELGPTTNNRKWFLDVNTGTFDVPDWLPVCGMTEFTPSSESNMEDTSDFDGEGWQRSDKTAQGWSVEATVRRGTLRTDPTEYDPGQEYLRGLADGKFGAENEADIRYYEMTPNGPRAEAYRGFASVQWNPAGGGMSAVSTVGVVLTGQGKRTPITHPDA